MNSRLTLAVMALFLFMPVALSEDTVWVNPVCLGKRGPDYTPVIDYSVKVNKDTIVVDASKSFSPAGIKTSVFWDLDDDEVYETKGKVVMHKFSSSEYSDNNKVRIGLRVRDNCGNVNEVKREVELKPSKNAEINQKPKASFYTKMLRSTVVVDASQSFDPDGNIVSYEWDWESDGIYDDEGMLESHYYSKDGIYTITLRTVDSEGETSIKQRTISFKKEEQSQPSTPTGMITSSFVSNFESIMQLLFWWL